jgi:CHASE2 domain-containing sensor protein
MVVTGWLEPVDLTVYDHLFTLRGPRPVASPIIIAAIDPESIRVLGPWPFPRAMHGTAVDALTRARARVVAFDVAFPEPSSRGADDDEALGAAIARAGNVVLATFSYVDAQPFYTRRGVALPIGSIRYGAAAIGSVTGEAVGRRAEITDTTVATTHGSGMPGFAVEVSRLAVGKTTAQRRLEGGDFLINFRGPPGAFRRVPYHRLVRGETPAHELAGVIVLIGVIDPAVPDFFQTPFARDGKMSGVEIHANAVETLLRGNAIREIPVAASAAVTVVAGICVGALVAWWPGRAAEAALLLLLLTAAGTNAAFAWGDVWFRPSGAVLALAVGLVLAIVARGDRPPADA